MLKPGVNLKLGLPLLVIAFVVSFLALYGTALWVDKEESAASAGDVPIPGGPTVVTIVAQSLKFDKNTITANAGLDVTVTLENRDAGVPHNVAFYTNRSAAQKIFGGELITGVSSETFTFPAPGAPGNYFFRCDAHPDTMTGTFIVQ
jgi:plastocyanin